MNLNEQYLKYELTGFKKYSFRFFCRKKRIDFLLNLINKTFENNLISILDAGCGPGFVAFELTKRGYNVTGIDILPEFIVHCKKINKNGNFIVKNLEKDFTSNKKFDCIICTETIEHLKNPKKTLIKFKKMLNNHGIVIISTPNYRSFWPLIEFLSKCVFRKINWNHSHVSKFTPKTLMDTIKMCGFKRLYISTIFLISPFFPKKVGEILYNFERILLNEFLLGSLIYIVCSKNRK